MKQRIRRLSACIITLALLLTICPTMGMASAPQGDLSRTANWPVDPATVDVGDTLPGISLATTGSISVSVSINGLGDEYADKTFYFYIGKIDGNASAFTVNGFNSAFSQADLEPGEYFVRMDQAQSAVDGYTTTVSGEGPVTVEAGQTTEVSIGVTYMPDGTTVDSSDARGELNINLSVTGLGSEYADKEYTFLMTNPDGTSDHSPFRYTAPTSTTVGGLVPGEYTVTVDPESAAVDGYTYTISGDGPVMIYANETANVNLVLSYEPLTLGELYVSFKANGLPEEYADTRFDFYLVDSNGSIINSMGYENQYTLSFSWGSLDPGKYTIMMDEELSDIPGYNMNVSGLDTVTVYAGQTTETSIVVSYEPIDVVPICGLIIATTVTGAQEEAANKDFIVTVSGPHGFSETYTITGESAIALYDATPGEYTITEDKDSAAIDGYTLTVTGEGTANIEAGLIAQFVIQNSYTPIPSVSASPSPTPTPTPAPTPTPTPVPDVTAYIDDRDENIELPVRMLEEIEDVEDAVEAVQELTDRLTEEQKTSPTTIDIATLYAERAAAKTAVVEPGADDELLIDAALLHRVEGTVKQAVESVKEELEDDGIHVARKIPKTVILYVGNRTSFVAKVHPDVLTTDVDKVRVETDRFAITFKLDDLAPDLNGNGILRFKLEEASDAAKTTGMDGVWQAMPKAAGGGKGTGRLAVRLTMPEGGTTKPVTLSLYAGAGEKPYETMMLNDAATPSKYNPVTITIDGKTSSSGTYTTAENEVDFTDIKNKGAEMQEAIKNLASRGILAGTTETTFSPDDTITRSQIASLLAHVLTVFDEYAVPTFIDVTTDDWFYAAAGSVQKVDLMRGFGDNRFGGTLTMSKEQIMVVSATVLLQYMDYDPVTAAERELYLGRYQDEIVSWGKDNIALATKANLVVYRSDEMFLGTSDMTRGEAAIVINRLFRRLW